MKSIMTLSFAAAFLAVATPAISQTVDINERSIERVATPNDTSSFKNDLKRLSAPIRSQGELDIFLQSYQKTVLDLLPPSARQEFISSLTFNDRGLTSFSTDVLEKHLTASEAYRLLAHFGLEGGIHQLDGLSTRTSLDAAIMSQNGIKENSFYEGSPVANWHQISDDFLDGYYCESRGTCSKLDGKACTANC